MKRLCLVLLLLATLFSSIMVSPVSADEGGKRKVGDKIALSSGDEAVFLGMRGKQEIWQATFGDPKYVKGTSTPYNTQWYFSNGVYTAGANDFTASVLGKEASIAYNGKTSKWNPETSVGTTKAKEKTATPELLFFDPINANYQNNTLVWDYENGVKRYLRIIEGMLIEYYKIDKPLSSDFSIESKLIQDVGFAWHRPASAWDANGEPIDLTSLGNYNYTLSSSKTKTKTDKNIAYPITIDPDTTFYTSASDSYMVSRDPVWATVRGLATANLGVYPATIYSYTYSMLTAGQYWNEKSAFYFDTSSLPDSLIISDTRLYVYPYSRSDDDNAQIYIVNGMSTYPHDPNVIGDYALTNYGSYASNYGWADVGTDITINQYNLINVQNGAALQGIVNRTGYTKLVLVTDNDFNNAAPTGSNGLFIYTYEQGLGYRAQLVVTYTITAPSIQVDAASNIALTSARLNATVIDDGQEASQVRFGFGNVTQLAANFALYDVITDWSAAEWTTGEHPYYDASSLNDTATYYYRAQIMNSNSTVTSTNEINFTTLAALNPATNFRAYPAMTSVTLSWVIGSGASQTQVVYSSTGFPTNNTTGTIVYTGTGNTYIHTSLTAGKTYYYSAWGESGGSWSATYATVAVTTSAFTATSEDIETPGMFAEWFQAPDYTNLSTLEPVYSAVNAVADGLGTPRNTFWMGVLTILLAVISVGLMVKVGWIAGITVGGVGTAFGVAIHLLPAWYIFIIILAIALLWAINARGVGAEK